MKKIISTLLAIGWLATGCSDKECDMTQSPTFEVASADVEYGASGGSGTIELVFDGGVVHASVEKGKDWCSVATSGSTIKITVAPNGQLQSRESALTIKKDGYTRRMGIYQSGTLFYVEEYGMLGDKVGSVLEIPFVCEGDMEIAVEGHPDWAEAVWEGDKLIVTATQLAPMDPRSGDITLSVDGVVKTITVTQQQLKLGYDDFVGEYTMTAYDASSNLQSYDVTIEKQYQGQTLIIKGLLYDIVADYADGEITFNVGQKVGTYTSGTYSADIIIRAVNDGSSSSTTSSYYMYSTYEMVDGKIVLTLNLQHTSGTAYSGFGFYYVNSTGGNTYRAKYRTEIKLIPK